jgi:predicted RNase H-like nuclease (RuvC/YqgF family)
VENGTLLSLAEKGSFGPSLAEGLRDLEEHLQRRSTLEERAKTTHAELESLHALLSKHGAMDNHNRRIEELTIRVRDADRRLETLITLSAREFVDRFMDEDGLPSCRDSATVDDPFASSGPYRERLEECSSLRVEVSRVRKSIQSIETALRIEALDRGVLSMERTISECQRKIAALNAQVDSLAKSIDESKTERENLCALKREIDDSLA